jgi:hypothetical protein
MIEQATEMLTKLVVEAGDAMNRSADRLDGRLLPESVTEQSTAVEILDDIYLVVVPFPELVGRAVSQQQELVDVVDAVQDSASSGPDAETDEPAELVEPPPDPDDASANLEPAEIAWQQQFIARWAEVLGPKAEQGLQNLPEIAPHAGPDPEDPRPSDLPDADAMQQQMQQQIQEQQQQVEAMKSAMERAVELGPEIHSLAADAVARLQEQQFAAASPKQQQALELLREIADLLPKQDQPSDQNQPADEQGDDEQQQEQEQQQQPPEQQREQEQQMAEELSQRQAEAVLRKVRERQRDRRDLEKELDRQLFRPGTVPRDW